MCAYFSEGGGDVNSVLTKIAIHASRYKWNFVDGFVCHFTESRNRKYIQSIHLVLSFFFLYECELFVVKSTLSNIIADNAFAKSFVWLLYNSIIMTFQIVLLLPNKIFAAAFLFGKQLWFHRLGCKFMVFARRLNRHKKKTNEQRQQSNG